MMMMEAHVCVCVWGYIIFPSEQSVKEEIQGETENSVRGKKKEIFRYGDLGTSYSLGRVS